MNLQSKKARLPIAALGVTALCSGGIGIFASPALAATEIALNSGATSIAVANFGYTNADTANAAYALKTQEASLTNTVLSVESAPTGGKLAYDQVTNNGVATTSFTQVPTGSSSAVNEVQTLAFDAVPDSGTYTVTVAGVTTGTISGASGVSASDLQTALNTALGSSGSVAVTGAGSTGSPFSITFGGALAGTNVGQLTVDTLTGALESSSTPVNGTPGTTTQGAAAVASATTSAIGTLANTDYVYVTGDVPGAYKFRIFQDTNANNVYDSADERSTALVNMTVYDMGGLGTTASDTSDDVVAVVNATSPTSSGDPIPSEITYSKPLSMSDARGSAVATGLAGRIADRTYIDVTSTAAGVSTATNQKPDYSTTTGKATYAIGTPTGAGTITLKTDLAGTTGAVSYTAATPKAITVTATNVATVDLAATASDGKVKTSGTAVAVKAGTGTVEYTATAKDSASPALPVAGAKVTFTLTGTDTAVAKLSADGTAGATTTTSKVYTATTDAKGVATLKVTTTDPSATSTYGVAATSNGHSGTPLTTTYAAAAAAKITTTSTAAELTPTVGTTSVAIKGTVWDQFDGPFAPSSSDPQQVTIQIPDGTQAGFASLSSSGTFSYTYTAPTTPAPAVGDTTSFDFVYGTLGTGGTDSATEGGTIRWASTAAVSKITLTTPGNGAKAVNLLGNAAPLPTQGNTGSPAFGNTTGAVTGTVYDANNAVLAYKTVTLKGGNGVWFSKTATPGATDKLVETIDVVSDASGAISGAYVYFAKSGDHKVTASSGGASAESTVTVAAPAANAGWHVEIDDVAGAPGSTLIVTGKVTDIFGNAVPDAVVGLTADPATVGSLGNSSLITNNAGVFSTTFVTGSNSGGEVELTAEITNNLTTLTPNATLVATGFTAPEAMDKATGKVLVAKAELSLSATAKIVAGAKGGTAKLSGDYLPGTSIDIWGKPSGSGAYSLMDTVTSDDEGEFGASVGITKSTRFVARANGVSSPSKETQLWSAVKLTAKALGKGKVQLMADGNPNTKAPLTFYRSIAGKDPVLKTITSDNTGVGRVTVSLPKGTRSVYVTYKAQGTGGAMSTTVKVKVK
ncbi:hypothetical protein KIH74_20745 [Kineosporia sp. J2-2]|uniref:Big-1 domain-containing protein n=1 Tax=Kineosporia corallincola TaxID=2835133 RepID=A0ABS5TJU3_9ACTN|nr:hypothetical protein [Kineosporia corallincola]MBT0771378.1 hypothetical protein [Kineosporia corallincola]